MAKRQISRDLRRLDQHDCPRTRKRTRRRYCLVITEEIAGFPGAVCIKQVHVVAARAAFDRKDKDNQVFSGGCDGLASIAWNGKQIQGTVALAAALDGAQVLELKGSAAGGQVHLSWTER